MENLQTKISLFRSLFKGREDVFASRWEKDKKSGYMTAYFFDPYRYRTHKMKGGTFQNYPDKSYLQLTDDQIAKHLNGEQVVGLYPLLSDIRKLTQFGMHSLNTWKQFISRVLPMS